MPEPKQRAAKAAAALTPEIVEIFGAPPLLSTEDAGAYDDMLAKLANAVHPGDIIACLLIKDIADKRTEIARWRRQKAALVEQATQQQREAKRDFQLTRLAIAYERDDAAERERANKEAGAESRGGLSSRDERMIRDHLRRHESSPESRLARLQQEPTELDFAGSLHDWIDAMEQLDALERAAERQFQNALAALDAHLEGLGPRMERRLQANLAKVVDGAAVTLVPAETGSRPSRHRTG